MMDHQPEQYLSTHRFQISRKSRELLHTLLSELPLLNKELKIIKGLSFFGSRSKGLEKKNFPISPDLIESDLDFCVFYDGAVFGYDSRLDEPPAKEMLRVDRSTGDVTLDGKNSQQQADRNYLRRKFEADLQSRMKERINNYFDNKVHQEGRSIFIVDISERATLRSLNEFYDSVNQNEFQFSEENNKLLARFFLGVGEGLYKNRRFIFDQLKKKPKGDELLQILMLRLGEFERTRDDLPHKPTDNIIPYTGYPKTIREAEKYFLTRQY